MTDRRGVIGVINFARLEGELAEGADKKLGELVDAQDFPHVHADQGLDLALERMGANQIEILPVVSRADLHKLEGILCDRGGTDALLEDHRSCWTHVYAKPVEHQLLRNGSRTQISLGQANTAHKLFKARVRAERIESRAQ